MPKLNILYIHSHDTGRYTSPYGHAVSTPNIQKLAEEGTLFRQAFCVCPTCSPSRSALLTGSYPHNNGMFGLAHRGFVLNDYGQHLAHTLKKAGYATALAGIQHLTKPDRPNLHTLMGYDRHLGEPKVAHESAVAFLKNPPSQPFFLDVGFFETHRVFPKIEECLDNPNYCLPPSTLPDTPETRSDMACFKASARILDRKVGEVLQALEESGQAANTLIVCTTDHGAPFPRMKCHLQDSGTGVMLIVKGPGGFNGGNVIDGAVSHMDLFPTICELAGIERPAWLQGKSVLPLVRGEAQEIHDELFFEINYHAAYEPMRAVRTKRWKYIRQFDGRGRTVLPNKDNGPSKDVWVRAGWRERPVPAEELYDLVFDPNETCNLAAQPEHKDNLANMRARLLAWMEETNDPMLRGPAPAPDDAVADPADNHSPGEGTRPILELYGPTHIASSRRA